MFDRGFFKYLKNKIGGAIVSLSDFFIKTNTKKRAYLTAHPHIYNMVAIIN